MFVVQAGPAWQRSLAVALFCRIHGVWPTWCTGVRTAPFRAHAWIEVDGVPMGESFGPGYYTRVMTVPAVVGSRVKRDRESSPQP